METERCAALLCAIETGTITGAAERLGYTTSGLSKLLASLEDETGLTLLHRGKQGIVPTEDCRALLPYLRQLTAAADGLAEMTAELKGLQCGTIRVGTSYQGSFRTLAGIIADYTAEYPGIRIELLEGTSSGLYQLLQQGRADLCLLSRRDGYEAFTETGQDELVIWLPDRPEYRAYEDYPVRQIEHESYIELFPGTETDNSVLLKKLGLRPTGRYTASDVYAAHALVEAGLGVALINRMLAEQMPGGVLLRSLRPRQYIQVGIAERRALGPAAQRFRQYLTARL